jgi:hypothetical protein
MISLRRYFLARLLRKYGKPLDEIKRVVRFASYDRAWKEA